MWCNRIQKIRFVSGDDNTGVIEWNRNNYTQRSVIINNVIHMNSAVRNNYVTWKKWLMLGNKHHCCKKLGRYSQLKTHRRREKSYFLGTRKKFPFVDYCGYRHICSQTVCGILNVNNSRFTDVNFKNKQLKIMSFVKIIYRSVIFYVFVVPIVS